MTTVSPPFGVARGDGTGHRQSTAVTAVTRTEPTRPGNARRACRRSDAAPDRCAAAAPLVRSAAARRPLVSTPDLTLPTPDQLLADVDAAFLRGATAEALALCREGGRRLRDAASPGVFAGQLARGEARAALLEGNPDAALDALGAALAIAECTGDAHGAAHALNNTAVVHFQRGDLDVAEPLYAAARARARAAGALDIVANATLNLGIVATVRGDLRRARAHYRRALADFRTLGHVPHVVRTLNNLGLLYADEGQWDRAERAYAEALGVCVHAGDLEAAARLHGNLAEVWAARGDLARAEAACGEGMAVCDRTAHGAARGELHRTRGVVAREAGRFAEADAHLAAAERFGREREDLLLQAETAREQADLFRRQSRNRDTLQALNRAHRLFEQLRARRALADIGRRMGRLEDEFVEVARRWGESIEANDRYTQGHCQRVADLACLIAAHAGPAHGFDAQALFWFRIGALLHDVGKLDIPADVLNKPGKLTDAEFALMRGHTEAGVALLADIEFPWDVRPVVLSHHERWDGRGYPHRLAGDAIPLTARILGVADVYDALTSVRSYKRAMSHDEATTILRQDAGTAFDPQVVAWFEAVAPVWVARSAGEQSACMAHTAEPADVRAQRRALGLDEATGLPGRQAFFVECARVLAARAHDGRPTALLLVTLDPATPATPATRPAADGVAAVVAEALSRHTRGGDFVGRYAAGEFVVLLADVSADEAHATAGRLAEVAGDALADAGDDARVAVHVAVGIAPSGSAAPEALLAAADAARRRGTPDGASGAPRRVLAAVA